MDLTPRDEPLPVAEVVETGASRGQILVLFAMFLVGMTGILGLATDLGMAFSQRRSMQNAADAGALAGARAIARWTKEAPTSAQADVASFVAANNMTTIPTHTCIYVDYANNSQGTCNAPVPPPATGVSVEVSEVHDTFFIRVVPGAPDTVTVVATATSHVERLSGFPSDSPFIVCGTHSWAAINRTGTTYANPGADVPILKTTTNDALNPDAIGVTYYVHHNQMSQGNASSIKYQAGCETTSARFNGITDQLSNTGKTARQWMFYTEGTAAGPVLTAVNGVQGCKVGQKYDCVMLIPIAVNSPSEAAAPAAKNIYVVGYAAFFVTYADTNSTYGRLLDDYIVSGPSEQDWCRDCNSGAAVIRLTS